MMLIFARYSQRNTKCPMLIALSYTHLLKQLNVIPQFSGGSFIFALIQGIFFNFVFFDCFNPD